MPSADFADNTATREKLKALIAKLSDADLARPLDAGWTVAASLAHIAFWDQRALNLLEKWEHHGVTPSPLPADVDAVNDATKPLCLAIPPRAAAELMLTTAETLDNKIEHLSPELVAAIAAAGQHVGFGRWHHRHEHLTELEALFSA